MRERRWQAPSEDYLEHVTRVRVRFQEVDPLRVVWHGHYLSYFEEGRTAFGRAYGFGYDTILEAGFVAPIVHVELDYFLPARFDQVLQVVTRMHHDEGARIQFTYRILSEEGQKLTTGRSVQALTEPSGELVLVRPEMLSTFYSRWDQLRGQ